MKLTFILSFLSCLVMTLAPSRAQEPIALRLNLAPKFEYSMRLVANQTIALVTKKKKDTLTQSLTQDWIYDVREVRADGTTILGCKISAISFDQKRPDGTLSWNSRDGKPAPEPIDFFGVLIGARFSLELDKSGRIRRVIGLNELTERVLAFYDLGDKLTASMRPLMRKTVGDNTFKNIGNLMASFPDAPLQIGQNWKKIDPLSGSDGFDYDTTCVLQQLENGVATIGVKSVLVAQKNATTASRNPFFAGATQTGTLLVDTQSGWTNNAQVVLRNVIQSPQGRVYIRSEMQLSPIETP